MKILLLKEGQFNCSREYLLLLFDTGTPAEQTSSVICRSSYQQQSHLVYTCLNSKPTNRVRKDLLHPVIDNKEDILFLLLVRIMAFIAVINSVTLAHPSQNNSIVQMLKELSHQNVVQFL